MADYAHLTLRTYMHTFSLLKNEEISQGTSTTNEQDNKAASCTYSCPWKDKTKT